MIKQVIVINKGLKMRRGKEIAQGAHASMAWLTSRLGPHCCECGCVICERNPEGVSHCGKSSCVADIWTGTFSLAERLWMAGIFAKIVCQVDSEAEMLILRDAAVGAGLETHLIVDRGLTEFHGEPTITALGIGPDYDDKIDKITGDLRLY